MRLRALLFAFVVLVIGACSSIDCPVENQVFTVYGVYSGEEVDTLHDTLYVWSKRSDGKDTLLLNRGVNLSNFFLPISNQHPEDILIFLVADTAGHYTLDTVWIKKEDIPHFESVDCNPTFFHRLTSVRSTHRGIDTITINRSSVEYETTSSTAHFHIDFKARR
jgi:hypothetical protein